MESLALAGRVAHPDGEIKCGTVVIENGVIAGITVEDRAGREDEPFIVPGFIDLQVNGALGHDFMARPDSVRALARDLPRTGVTAFLPTITSSPIQDYPRYLSALD